MQNLSVSLQEVPFKYGIMYVFNRSMMWSSTNNFDSVCFKFYGDFILNSPWSQLFGIEWVFDENITQNVFFTNFSGPVPQNLMDFDWTYKIYIISS